MIVLSATTALPFGQKLLMLFFTIEEISVASDYSVDELDKIMGRDLVCRVFGVTALDHPPLSSQSRILQVAVFWQR